MRRLTCVPAAAVFLLIGSGTARAQEERPVLELSLDEAVKRAMDNNLDIKVESFNPLSSEQDVRSAKGYYDPFVFASLNTNSQTQPQSNFFTGGTVVETDGDVWNIGVNQALPTGGAFSVAFNNGKTETNSVFPTFNPSFSSDLTFAARQPLLQFLRLDAPRRAIQVSKKNREITDEQFRQAVVNILATVKAQYYELLFACLLYTSPSPRDS